MYRTLLTTAALALALGIALPAAAAISANGQTENGQTENGQTENGQSENGVAAGTQKTFTVLGVNLPARD